MKVFKLYIILLIFSISCTDDDISGGVIPPGGSNNSNPSVQIVENGNSAMSGDTLINEYPFDIAFRATKGMADLESWTFQALPDSFVVPLFEDIPVTYSDGTSEVIEDIQPFIGYSSLDYVIIVKDVNGNVGTDSLTLIFGDNTIFGNVKLLPSATSVFMDTTVLPPAEQFAIIISAKKRTEAALINYSILLNDISLASFDKIPVPDPNSFSMRIENLSTTSSTGVYDYSFEVTDAFGIKYAAKWTIIVQE